MKRSIAVSLLAALITMSQLHADDVPAPVRYPVSIQPQDLATALNSFAQLRQLYIIYAQHDVLELQTRGASGELTQDEVLLKLLGGTGLTYRYIDDRTVTILPIAKRPDARNAPAAPAESASRKGDSAVRGKGPKSLWRRLAFAREDAARAETARPFVGREQATPADYLEGVVVTAQKKEQDLIDVPISMSALGTREIQALRVQGFDDFALTIPNLTFASFGRYFGYDISIRGLTTFTGGLFQSTSVTVDDAGYGATDTASILSTRFLDIERVEILRGPQGTLSGRNSMGGSINIITAKPNTHTAELTGTLDVGRFDTRFYKLAGNLPLGANLAIRAMAYKEDSDGAVRNVVAGNSSSTDNLGGSVALRWTPSARFTLDLSFGKEEQDYGMDNFMGARTLNVETARPFYDERFAEWGGNYYDGAIDYLEDVGGNGGRVSRDTDEAVFLENQIAAARLTYVLDSHTIMLLGGQHEFAARQTHDFDRTEYSLYRNYSSKRQRGRTAELRVASNYRAAVNWVAGISYLHEKRRSGVVDEAGMWLQEGSPFVAPYVIPALGTENDGWRAVYVDDFRLGIQSNSAYANLFLDVGEHWQISAGTRFTRDETSYSEDWDWDATQFQPTLTDNFDTHRGSIDQFSHRLALTRELDDDTNVYLQWSTGYRPGYANRTRLVHLAGAPKVVDAERVTNYELGLKGEAFARRLTYAAALFWMAYDKLQVTTQLTNPNPENWLDNFLNFDVNSGSASIQGFELETTMLLTQQLELRLGAGYNDGNIDRVTLDGVTYRDVDIPGARKFTANASGIYTRAIGANLLGQLRIDYNYQSERVDAIEALPEDINPSFKTVNLSAGIFTDRWSLAAYFENVLDEVYWHDLYVGNYPYRGAQAMFDPRAYGVRFTYSFAGYL